MHRHPHISRWVFYWLLVCLVTEVLPVITSLLRSFSYFYSSQPIFFLKKGCFTAHYFDPMKAWELLLQWITAGFTLYTTPFTMNQRKRKSHFLNLNSKTIPAAKQVQDVCTYRPAVEWVSSLGEQRMTHMQSPTALCGRTSGSCGRIPNVHRCFCPVEGPVWSRCPSTAPEPGTQSHVRHRGSDLKPTEELTL